MSNNKIDKVRELAQGIMDLYESGEFTHEELSKQLAIPTEMVRKVTREFNWQNTKHRELDLNNGQKVKMVVDYNKIADLLKYPIAEKIKELKRKYGIN